MRLCPFAMVLFVFLAGAAPGGVAPAVVGARSGRGDVAIEPDLRPLIDHVLAHPDGRAPCSIDFGALGVERASLPIGVFDSGIGGLTVLERILALDAFDNRSLAPGPDGIPDLAGERFLYYGDQANMPYGNYAARGKTTFLRELVLKDAVFLLGVTHDRPDGARRSKPPVKALVVACNTATAVGMEPLRAALRAWRIEIPIIGVIDAGARALNRSLPAAAPASSRAAVAVLATVGTCASGAYPKAISRAALLAGKPIPHILQHGSVGLAAALEANPAFVRAPGGGSPGAVPYLGPSTQNRDAPIERALIPVYGFAREGILGEAADPDSWRLNSIANYVRYDVASLVERYRVAGGGPPIGAVVLGCTHFPIALGEITRAFARVRGFVDPDGNRPYAALIADRIEFVDPAEFTARELFIELARRRLRAVPRSAEPPALAGAFVSVPNPDCPGVRLAPDGSFDPDYRCGRAPGRPEFRDTLRVEMHEVPGLMNSVATLAPALPNVWTRLRQESIDSAERARGQSPSAPGPGRTEPNRETAP